MCNRKYCRIKRTTYLYCCGSTIGNTAGACNYYTGKQLSPVHLNKSLQTSNPIAVSGKLGKNMNVS